MEEGGRPTGSRAGVTAIYGRRKRAREKGGKSEDSSCSSARSDASCAPSIEQTPLRPHSINSILLYDIFFLAHQLIFGPIYMVTPNSINKINFYKRSRMLVSDHSISIIFILFLIFLLFFCSLFSFVSVDFSSTFHFLYLLFILLNLFIYFAVLF